MIWRKGYYSIIQYCPDLSRGEVANIGVLLFCPEVHFIQAKVAEGNDRIRRFFGQSGHQLDLTRINAIKQSIIDRLKTEKSSFNSLEDLQRFIDTRANLIQITQPRFLKVHNPDAQLENLFDTLIGSRDQSRRHPALQRRIAREFKKANVSQWVRENINVTIPAFQRKVTMPFGFRNGRLNLIQPVRFEGKRLETVESAACRLAIEGKSLYDAQRLALQMQLFVVADFVTSHDEERRVISSLLEAHKVRVFSAEDINPLIQDIQQTAKSFDLEGVFL